MSASLLHDSAVDVMVAVIQNMVLTKMGEGEVYTGGRCRNAMLGVWERMRDRERWWL